MRASRFMVLVASTALSLAAMAQSYDEPAAPSSSDNSGTADVYRSDAQSNQPSSDQSDPPARVARLAFVRGEVSFAPAGENDWVQAQLNRPLVTGDKLWTDAGGRAELDVGPSTIRMDQHTSFDFLNLNDHTAQVELTQGTLNLAVRRTRDDESFEVDTPTLAFIANRAGDYRIDVDAQHNTTTVTVRRGSAEIYGEGGARMTVNEGQSLVVDNPQLQNYRIANVPSGDEFDSFVASREQRYERTQSRNYVSDEVVGYEDLDDNGTWSDAPEYGHVWYPNDVAADWAPYHDGRWSWVDPWGWTWVDDAPWGFAPFHYGRWAYIDSRWGWVPGPVDVRPVYAPALVAFVGGGFSVGISAGEPVGWFPLGPRDVYFPGYRCGRNYFTSINVSNARVNYATVNNYYGGFARGNINYAQVNYAYRNRPEAVMAVSASAFSGGRPVRGAALAMDRANFANARIMARPAIAPTRASVLAADGNGARRAPPPGVLNRAVVAARTPPPAPPSFAARQRLLQRAPGQPLTTTQMRSLAAQQPQRGPQVRTVAAARADRFNAGRGMQERDAAAMQDRNIGRGPRYAPPVRGEDRTAFGANRRALPNQPSATLRSSGYAHSPGGENRASQNQREATAMQRGNAPTVRAPVDRNRFDRNTPATGPLPSSEFARTRDTYGRGNNTRDNRGETMQQRVQSAQREPPRDRAAPPRAENRVAMPQRAYGPQREPQTQRGVSSRDDNRFATQHAPMQQRERPIDRGAPPRADNRVAMPQRTYGPQREAQTQRDVSPRDDTRFATQRAPMQQQHERPIDRGAPPRAENRVAMPQQRMQTPQRPAQVERATPPPRAENRTFAMPQQQQRAPQYARPVEQRSAPPPQMTARAPQPGYQRPERAPPAQPAMRAEARPAPQQFAAPPASQQRAPAPQQYASRRNAGAAPNTAPPPKKDKDDKDRH